MKIMSFALLLLAAPSLVAQDSELQPVVFDPTPEQTAYNVRLAIYQEPALRAEGVAIDDSVDGDHFVILTGIVPDAGVRAFAEQRISQVPGVRWVTNNLKVGELRFAPQLAAAPPEQ